ncbi:MAG: hypothetical protein LBV74_06450 [Tannerella sp.]|jgi:hypothetical protein|nr:hypothetical protein [Tannerella sp.]
MKQNIKYLIILFLSSSISSLIAQVGYIEKRNNVGDIVFDASTDNPKFDLIDEINILPYNSICGFLIEGERFRVLEYYCNNFKSDTIDGVTGYITIRFIVNFKGETDRFRVYEMDNKYNPCKFPDNISKSLLELTRNLDGWITLFDDKFDYYNCIEMEKNGEIKYAYDYYQYILFKMKDGQIETILP